MSSNSADCKVDRCNGKPNLLIISSDLNKSAHLTVNLCFVMIFSYKETNKKYIDLLDQQEMFWKMIDVNSPELSLKMLSI